MWIVESLGHEMTAQRCRIPTRPHYVSYISTSNKTQFSSTLPQNKPYYPIKQSVCEITTSSIFPFQKLLGVAGSSSWL
uniref:Uncharacterized protein n=1 Tax=Cannabis sativa TaxID=3483 RepID=A0A803R771_CANSA